MGKHHTKCFCRNIEKQKSTNDDRGQKVKVISQKINNFVDFLPLHFQVEMRTITTGMLPSKIHLLVVQIVKTVVPTMAGFNILGNKTFVAPKNVVNTVVPQNVMKDQVVKMHAAALKSTHCAEWRHVDQVIHYFVFLRR